MALPEAKMTFWNVKKLSPKKILRSKMGPVFDDNWTDLLHKQTNQKYP